MERLMEEFQNFLAGRINPDMMSQSEYREFLKEIIEECNLRLSTMGE
jgi:hypothetical protein